MEDFFLKKKQKSGNNRKVNEDHFLLYHSEINVNLMYFPYAF